MTLQETKSKNIALKESPANRNDFDHILKVIYESISDLNFQLSRERRIEPSPATVLFGAGGRLDSLGLANFIVIAEQKLDESFGFRIDLTENDPFSPETGHFRTIEALATYISELISNK
jgi:acyl carrier protein